MPTADNNRTTIPAVVAPAEMPAFRFDGRTVRIYDRDGEPVFDARDVSRELGYKEPAALTRRLDLDERSLHRVQTPGGAQEISIVTEPGLYRAIASRRQVTTLGVVMSDRVARFQRWVYHEVLPSIRRTGGYGVPAAPAAPDMMALMKDPAVLIEVLGHYARENITLTATVAEKTQALAVAAPKLDAYEALLDAEGLLTLSNTGRILGVPHDAWMEWLRNGFLTKEGGILVPRGPFLAMGAFTIRTHLIGGLIRPQTYVTPKGLIVLRRRWNKGPGALAKYLAEQQRKLPGIADQDPFEG